MQLVAASFLEAIVAQIAVEPPDPRTMQALAGASPAGRRRGRGAAAAMIPGATAKTSGGAEFVARRLGSPTCSVGR